MTRPSTAATAASFAARSPAAVARRLEGLGGRFLTRTQLAVRALYWLLWLSFSRRTPVTSGVQREGEALALGALSLVLASAFLVGIIASLQIAYQLKVYSALAVTPRAIAWFTGRELGPLVVALLVVARSASAIAGELASMSANGEIDALRAMGLDPVKYLVAPKLAALFVGIPALTMFADLFIGLGGWVANSALGFTTNFFLESFRDAFSVGDLFVGLGKSIIFAFVIGVVASDEGLSGEHRVAAIGEAATRAVVFCMLGVLGADTFINAVFYFIPGLI